MEIVLNAVSKDTGLRRAMLKKVAEAIGVDIS